MCLYYLEDSLNLKEQLNLINKKPNDFKLLRPEIEARLDELETLLDYYIKKNKKTIK